MHSSPLLGIIGGYGPATSAVFCQRLVAYAQEFEGSHAPSFVMDSIPISFDDASLCIAGDMAATRRLVKDANEGMRRLGQLGVKSIVLPCNSVHALAHEFAIPEGVEFLHIADVCAKAIHDAGYASIGILASDMTLQSGFYQERFERQGITAHRPSSELQRQLNDAISIFVRDGTVSAEAHLAVENVLESLENEDVEAMALCCTDVSGLLEKMGLESRLPFVDSMNELARACANRSVLGFTNDPSPATLAVCNP